MISARQGDVVHQPVRATALAVYVFARQVQNLSQEALGPAQGVAQCQGAWYADSPMGEVQRHMAPHNPFGVMDHDVVLLEGTRVHNAFRVTPCGSESLLSFVVLRLAGTTQEAFDADVAHVRRDLAAPKDLIEQRHAG